MSEMAYYGGRTIKIGTCEVMHYLRYEQREIVRRHEHSLDPANCKGLLFRAPAFEEDGIAPGAFDNHEVMNPKGEMYYSLMLDDLPKEMAADLSADDNVGLVQAKVDALGMLVNVPCYHGLKLPDTGDTKFKVFWNGKRRALFVSHLKNTDKELMPIVKCAACGHKWRVSFMDIMPYLFDDGMAFRLWEQCGTYCIEKGGLWRYRIDRKHNVYESFNDGAMHRDVEYRYEVEHVEHCGKRVFYVKTQRENDEPIDCYLDSIGEVKKYLMDVLKCTIR